MIRTLIFEPKKMDRHQEASIVRCRRISATPAINPGNQSRQSIPECFLGILVCYIHFSQNLNQAIINHDHLLLCWTDPRYMVFSATFANITPNIEIVFEAEVEARRRSPGLSRCILPISCPHLV